MRHSCVCFGRSPWGVLLGMLLIALAALLPAGAQALLAAPSLVTPTNGAANVAVPVQLRWTAPAGAAGCSYRVQVATNETFTALVLNEESLATAGVALTTLQPRTRYFWRVQAFAQGAESNWSPVWNFLTSASITTIPPIPLQGSPQAGATESPLNPLLTWEAAARATYYIAQVSPSEQFATGLLAKRVTGLSAGFTNLQPNTVYFWRVRASNDSGASPWSSVRCFTTGAASLQPPTIPVLATPLDSTVGLGSRVNVSWQPAERATGYVAQIARNDAFTEGLVTCPVAETAAEFSGLAPETTYFWRVKAVNNTYESAWSSVWHFATAAIPPLTAPTLLGPANGAVDTEPRLTWTLVDNASSYLVQVARDSLFTDVLVVRDGITTGALELTNLPATTQLYWRVKALRESTQGPWSATWSFTTRGSGVLPPSTPQLSLPASGAADLPFDITLSWKPAERAGSYTVQVATNDGFTLGLITLTQVQGTTATVTGLAPATRYFWRVKAVNGGGGSAWSQPWSFTTGILPPVAPVLLTPESAATGVLYPAQLTWQAVEGATYYIAQVAGDEQFTEVREFEVTDTGVVLENLLPQSCYFWRVRAGNRAGASAWSAAWRFTTAAASAQVPAIPALVNPENGAVDIGMPARLTWTAVEGATGYIVQVAQDAAFMDGLLTREGVTGTVAEIANLVDGACYFWRVRAINAVGAGEWSAPWSFTTATGVLQAPPTPVQLTPLHLATDVQCTVRFSWGETERTVYYMVQYATNQGFTTGAVTKTVYGTTMEVTLQPYTRYFWRVLARNGAGASSWSPVGQFITVSQTPGLPAVPVLDGPANGAVNVPLPVRLTWHPAERAETYTLQLARNDGFTTALMTKTLLAGTAVEIANLATNTRYFWRVQAVNAAGVSLYTLSGSFTTAAEVGALPPTAPVLTAPQNGATGVTRPVLLTWGAAERAVSYTVQVATDEGFTQGLLVREQVTATSVEIAGLLQQTQYFWRVKAVGATGSAGPLSAVWSFTTEQEKPQPPAAPLLVAPDNMAANVPLPVHVSWQAVDGALSYTVQVARDEAFTEGLTTQTGLQALEYEVPGLANSTTYFWRVGAVNAAGTGPWSAGRRFTTLASTAPPDSPALRSPENGTTNAARSIRLNWEAISGATTYTVQIGTNETFTAGYQTKENLSAPTAEFYTLNVNTRYYWHVKAINANGQSPWSVTWSFTTMPESAPEPVAAPVLLSPANGASGVDNLEVPLLWESANLAVYYEAQVATNEQFTGDLLDITKPSAPSWSVPALTGGKRYFWRVRAVNTAGSGPWSAVWSFTTKPSTETLPARPTQISPATGATGISPTRIDYRWSTERAKYCILQLARNVEFTEGVMTGRYMSTVGFGQTGLLSGTQYYWRVRAVNSAGQSDWSTIWSFTTEGTSPTIPPGPTPISPAYGATGVSTPVRFSWSALTGAGSYAVRVARNTAFSEGLVTIEAIPGTSVEIGNLLLNTKYYWQVRAAVGSRNTYWSATWDFTTGASNAIGIPTLVSPANTETGVATTPTLTWTAVAGATAYSVQLATNDGFTTNLITRESVSDTSVTVTGLGVNLSYFWRVRAIGAGGPGNWSSAGTFTTGGGDGLMAPILTFPENAAVGMDCAPVFTWTAVEGAARYCIVYCEDATFPSSKMFGKTLYSTATSWQVPSLLGGKTYYWKVKAGSASSWGPFSDPWSFTTAASTAELPPVPAPTFPADGATGIAMNSIVGWAGSAQASYYTVQFSLDQTFATSSWSATLITAPEYASQQQYANTRIFWRVRAVNSAGASDWSPTWSFTTAAAGVNPPGIPTLKSPAQGETDVSSMRGLTWNAVSGATSYVVQIATDEAFTQLVLARDNVTTTSTSAFGLSTGTKYYWRVRSVSASGVSRWSQVRNFTTSTSLSFPGGNPLPTPN